MIFICRFCELSSRTLLLACVMAAYSAVVIPMLMIEVFLATCSPSVINPLDACVSGLFCWTATIRDAVDSQKYPGHSNFASRGFATYSSFRLLQLAVLLALWSVDFPLNPFSKNTCETAFNEVCEEVGTIQDPCHQSTTPDAANFACMPGTDQADCLDFALPPPPPPAAAAYTQSWLDPEPAWLSPDGAGAFSLSGQAGEWATLHGLHCDIAVPSDAFSFFVVAESSQCYTDAPQVTTLSECIAAATALGKGWDEGDSVVSLSDHIPGCYEGHCGADSTGCTVGSGVLHYNIGGAFGAGQRGLPVCADALPTYVDESAMRAGNSSLTSLTGAIETCNSTAACLGVVDWGCSGKHLATCVVSAGAERMLKLIPNWVTRTSASDCVHTSVSTRLRIDNGKNDSHLLYKRGDHLYSYHTTVNEGEIEDRIRQADWTSSDVEHIPDLATPVESGRNTTWVVDSTRDCNLIRDGPFNSFVAAGEACKNASTCSGIVAWPSNCLEPMGPFYTCGTDQAGNDSEPFQSCQSSLWGYDDNWESWDEISLGLCQGDCDSDGDCQEGLICFQRNGKEPVPGCGGGGRSSWDYCTTPTAQQCLTSAWGALGFLSQDFSNYYVSHSANPTCSYSRPGAIFYAEHWATSHGDCPALCAEPLATSCNFYQEYHHRELKADCAPSILLCIITGVLAYGVLGLLLHCAHINDSFSFLDRRQSSEGWRSFLLAAARKGIKGCPKELVAALAAGDADSWSTATAELAAKTPFEARRRLLKQHCSGDTGALYLTVARENLFENVVVQMRAADDSELRPSRIHVRFRNEPGIDMGGLRRDLFTLFGQGLATWGADEHPMQRLFKTAGSHCRFQPEPCAVEVHGVEEARDMYRAVGRFCAIAIKTEHLVDFSLCNFFWKRVLEQEVSMEENLEDLDREGDGDFARSMRSILENPLEALMMDEGLFSLSRTVSSAAEVGVRDRTVDLVLGGSEIEVTDENKEEYVEALLDHKMGVSISLAAEGFRAGIQDVLGPFVLKLFSADECQMLLGGEQGVSDEALEDWKANTSYGGSFHSSHDIVTWFWEVLSEGSPDFRAQVLWFQTGSRRVPTGGFGSEERNRIRPLGDRTEGLPHAHTCNRQIDLPLYSSKSQLEQMLIWAADSTSNAYGMA